MTIQWFPGHMNSARKKAAEALAKVDVVIEVVDARLPAASSNPMIETLRAHRQRPCLKLLNKSDLADPQATEAWLAHFNTQPGVRAVAISCKKPGEVARVPKLCQQLAPHRNDGTKPLRMIIMGIPNVGKSTLMNAMLKRRVAAVGDEPAVTKSQQRLDISPTMSLIDTPGMLWPKIAYESDGFMLAASHAIGVNAVAEFEVAAVLGQILLDRYPARLIERYKTDITGFDGVRLVEEVAQRRGCRLKGGGLDVDKAALILLSDYRSGALGQISLETPQSRAAMIDAAKAQAAEGDDAESPDEAEAS
ncbi:ribosome biogenesis GTPase YlqF [Denitromonas iodatirespirans]|uniref:Ribosome biogenesis GTPase A n=1 Tax=Denitromonas iodatirespirans TaxID=2795389 RepID=A0A944H9T8_DENI1|nr:ribosome biogenesis GTPase YlqF [Denitromonas iodatirespirans]MBT0963803.1 ribosome biogenesis GTPase YlqF [Denitromonas iodatirespirans]